MTGENGRDVIDRTEMALEGCFRNEAISGSRLREIHSLISHCFRLSYIFVKIRERCNVDVSSPFLLTFALSLPLLFLGSTAIVVIFFLPSSLFSFPFRVLFYIVAGTGRLQRKPRFYRADTNRQLRSVFVSSVSFFKWRVIYFSRKKEEGKEDGARRRQILFYTSGQAD